MRPWHPAIQSSALRYSRLIHAGGNGRTFRQRRKRGIWQFAGKGRDDHVGDVIAEDERCRPVAHRDTLLRLDGKAGVDGRAEFTEADEIIRPQTHFQAMLGRQLASQSPADADIAKIIDDAAEDIPVISLHRWTRLIW